MTRFKILYDEPQEAEWFRCLHGELRNADEESISSAARRGLAETVLQYDRPDIILLNEDRPILVVEETVEVPSGHNVGQRFARIAAAAEARVPSFYFGPYAARKHGGDTAGPRYMNLRLFQAFDAMIEATGSAITTINWPVDDRYEVRRDGHKDVAVREYLRMFLHLYGTVRFANLNRAILSSTVHRHLVEERTAFIRSSIRNPEQYDGPPKSVVVLRRNQFLAQHRLSGSALARSVKEVIRYEVGMNYIRSDPYTGMGMLYRYLYVARNSNRALILWFPNISSSDWQLVAARGNRKDVRLFRVSADGILFSDRFLRRGEF